MPGVYDRFTVNWSSQKGLTLAAKFRKLVGERGINRTLQQLVEQYVEEQEGGSGTKKGTNGF